MTGAHPELVRFAEFLKPNRRPYTLGPAEDADLVGMRWYGGGPFHRELKEAARIRKKTHFVIRSGDVIYNKLFAWKGAFGIVPSELDGMFVSDKFPTYELDTSLVLAEYLKLYFRFPGLWHDSELLSTGSAAISKLTLNPPRFLDLRLPLIDLELQRSLVELVDQAEAKASRFALLRESSAHVAAALLPGELNQVAEALADDLMGPLSEVLVGKPRNGWSPRCDNDSNGVSVLTLSAVTGYRFDRTALKRTSAETRADAEYWAQEGDLLITRSNTPELVGHAAIVSGLAEPCIYPDLTMRLRIDGKAADRRFVWYWLQSPLVRRYVRRKARGTSPTMKKINQTTVMNIPFPVGLDRKRQVALSRRFDSITEGSDALGASVKQAETAARALAPSLIEHEFSRLLAVAGGST
jgi:type I restriction enzyme S subunit